MHGDMKLNLELRNIKY